MRVYVTRTAAVAIACAAFVAGCSGSNDSGTPVAGIVVAPRATPTAVATASASAAPTGSASPSAAPSPTAVPSATPSPSATPAPTATPTAVPSGTLVVTPSSLSFITTGAPASQTVTASEGGYAGAFTDATATCSGIVTISAPTAAGVITVQPQNAGTCSFTVSDSNNQSATVGVTVTLTSGTVH